MKNGLKKVGLVGRCLLENETIYLTDIPENYLNITSGLGKENPKSLFLVPLILNDKAYGVIELASFNDFEPHVIEFVEKIGETIAAAISNINVNVRTVELLNESNKHSEALAVKEEEMRQNIEEMQATKEEGERREAELMSVRDCLENSVSAIEFDLNGKVLNANDEFLKTSNLSSEFVRGKTFSEVIIDKTRDFNSLVDSLRERKNIKEIIQIQIPGNDTVFDMTFNALRSLNDKMITVLAIGFSE